MTIDVASLLAGLARYQLETVLPTVNDPTARRGAGSMGLLLQMVARDIDSAPGRLRARIADIEAVLRRYAAAGGALPEGLLEAPVDYDRLSGLAARENMLKTALIAVEADVETRDAHWAKELQHDIIALYLNWTIPVM